MEPAWQRKTFSAGAELLHGSWTAPTPALAQGAGRTTPGDLPPRGEGSCWDASASGGTTAPGWRSWKPSAFRPGMAIQPHHARSPTTSFVHIHMTHQCRRSTPQHAQPWLTITVRACWGGKCGIMKRSPGTDYDFTQTAQWPLPVYLGGKPRKGRFHILLPILGKDSHTEGIYLG